ncbi:hypothetical protein EKH55_5712 (plasmid) [Sinorhizobium alkalisoli]|nr:hypothetical protein EKH55_5712 [Sinorhizobium alkalisoli]
MTLRAALRMLMICFGRLSLADFHKPGTSASENREELVL